MMTYDELKNIEINVLINGYMHRYDDKEFVKQCFLNGDGLKNDYESAKEDYESGDKGRLLLRNLNLLAGS